MPNMEGTTRHCALFLPSLSVGGAERMMINIANGLSQRGHNVDLVLVNAEGAFLDLVSDSVNIVDLSASRVLTSLPGLIRYLRNTDPDALLSTITPTNVISGWATHFPGVDTRHIIRVARPESEAARVQENTKKEQATAVLARHMYRYADEIVAISQGVAEDIRQHSSVRPDKINVIYNPVVTEELYAQAEEVVDHPWLNDNVPVILGVGRLVDQKDFATLIKAFAKLRERRKAKLLILGDGNRRDQLENLIQRLELTEDVELPGFAENPYKYMSSADVFVNSAIHEGFGNVIIEAMACELPIVATDCPGAPAELLDHGTYGRLVPVRDPNSMATAIERTLSEQTDKTSIAERAKEFSSKRAIKRYEAILFPT